MGDTMTTTRVVCSQSNAFVHTDDERVGCPACGLDVPTDEVPGFGQRTVRAHAPRPLGEGLLAAIDTVIAAEYPNACGDGVRAMSDLELTLLASLARSPYRVQRFDDIDRLAHMADFRQANRVSDNVVFAAFGGAR